MLTLCHFLIYLLNLLLFKITFLKAFRIIFKNITIYLNLRFIQNNLRLHIVFGFVVLKRLKLKKFTHVYN